MGCSDIFFIGWSILIFYKFFKWMFKGPSEFLIYFFFLSSVLYCGLLVQHSLIINLKSHILTYGIMLSNMNHMSSHMLISFLQILSFFLTGIHSMQGWTVTTRHEVARKRSTKRLKDTGKLHRKNSQSIGVS